MAEHMGKLGVVSVFLGVVPNKDMFDYYLRETRNEDNPGVATTCPLWDDLGVDWLDHDFQDAYYTGDVPVSLEMFLANPISYLDSFRPGVIESCSHLGIINLNAGLFLYNYEYPLGRPFPSPFFQFVGAFPYTVTTPEWFQTILKS